jgi:chromosome segregation ATPase
MTTADLIAEARRLGDPTSGDGWRRLLHGLAEALEQSQRSAADWEARANRLRCERHESQRSAADWEARANQMRCERDAICKFAQRERDETRKAAQQARNEADDLDDDLADAVDCLDQIGQMVGFDQADWGPDDRQRLVREVRERLAARSSSTEPSADA